LRLRKEIQKYLKIIHRSFPVAGLGGRAARKTRRKSLRDKGLGISGQNQGKEDCGKENEDAWTRPFFSLGDDSADRGMALASLPGR
jgi:hypothetical protein